MNSIYVDNNATTKVDPKVLDAMLPYFSEFYGNPSSMHSFGGNNGQKITQAREKLAALINSFNGIGHVPQLRLTEVDS